MKQKKGMGHCSKSDLQQLSPRFRANLVKSCAGYKFSKLLATRSGEGISEFPKTDLTEEYFDDFQAPYVAESKIKIGCQYQSEYRIKENSCLLIIGAIEHIYLHDEVLHQDVWVQLDKVDTISAICTDGYALPKLVDRFTYARPNKKNTSLFDGP